MRKWITMTLTGLVWTLGSLQAAELYVSPMGSDTNPGTKSKPLASIAVSQEKARNFEGKESVLVHVADGVYYLPETLVLTSADSGGERYPVVYRAENEGGAVLNGGSKLDLQWTPYRDGIFQAATPAGLVIDQLFINGQGQRMARYPNYDPEVAIFGGYAEDAISPERVAKWADPVGGYLHALHRNRWGSYHFRFTGQNSDGSIQSEGGWQTNRKDPMHDRYRFVENIREELDVPGEWYHDRKAEQLFFYPPAGMDLNSATVEVVRLRRLVELRGTREAPVRFISLSGLVFRHANRTFMESYEPILRSDWSIHRSGAIYIEGAEDCMLDHCSLEDLGGNAVFVSNYNRRILIRTCRIQDCGASGVVFLGNPAAVRNAFTKTQGDGGYAKLGLFIHWGPASVAGVEISWARIDHPFDHPGHRNMSTEEYDNLYTKFNPVKFQTDRAWESCMTMTKVTKRYGGGWSYRPDGTTIPYEEVINTLVQSVTGDGNLLLNVGPLPSGEFPADQIVILKRMG